jgi:hypothetical protein
MMNVPTAPPISIPRIKNIVSRIGFSVSTYFGKNAFLPKQLCAVMKMLCKKRRQARLTAIEKKV